MSSTFFGLTIAYSGLNTAQAQINTTANNISNVNTVGYSRQVVNTVASSALRCYQSWGTTGTGVEAESVTQHRDAYYDEKYWNNSSALGFYEKKQYYMNQIENYYSELNSQAGFSTIYAKMFNAMSTMQGSPGDMTVRKQFISTAKQLTEYFNQLSTKLDELQSAINDEIKTAVDDINAVSEKVAILTKQINVIEQGGGHANELRDQRSNLIDKLSKLVDVKVEEREVRNSADPDMKTGATYYTVYINGQVLVDTYEHNTLAVKSRELSELHNQSDIDGLYDIIWEKDGNVFNATPSSSGGELKAMFEVRDGNNKENLQGQVVQSSAKTITIAYTNTTKINELNLPSRGQLETNSTKYTYDDFSFNTNEDGEIETVTFYLNETLNVLEQKNVLSKPLEVGNAVAYMGIPYYHNQMNLFLRNFCEAFNNVEIGAELYDANGRAITDIDLDNLPAELYDKNGDLIDDIDKYLEDVGVDRNGDRMGSFFIAKDKIDLSVEHQMRDDNTSATIYSKEDVDDSTKKYESYYLLTAKNVSIAKKTDKDAALFATTNLGNFTSGVDAAHLIEDIQKLQSKTELFRGSGGDSFLQCMYSDVTVDTQECKIFTSNFTNIQSAISDQRMSIAGVDEDEEALDLIKFQNAYNLASKCISVFSEIYDRLILQTGV
ncbi:flagellar hook-associated protein 1 FlgK [Pseudobutyrivibrio sp. YE44]|uniref:flagellar hook-associated protein FlgK n=1 Tax=Pseudobutyrivibrio sp. YE44 TaxID=1520802 RepID=UPI0008884DB9|nr:flagellar hook-associated protein FlgK [Pseudobutyrivibrio sp. YE44]SDB37977.1 flagellar hook-associated protein 1 FlgK [Pseudobutyrivibrio sp. YE44]